MNLRSYMWEKPSLAPLQMEVKRHCKVHILLNKWGIQILNDNQNCLVAPGWPEAKTVKSAKCGFYFSRPPPGTSLPFSTHLSMTIFTHLGSSIWSPTILPISGTKKFLSPCIFVHAQTLLERIAAQCKELLAAALSVCSLSRVTVCVSILCNLPSIRWWRAINTIPQRQASRDSFKTKLVELYCTALIDWCWLSMFRLTLSPPSLIKIL